MIAILATSWLLGIVGQVPQEGGSTVPQPSILVRDWQLDFTFQDPQRIKVQRPGDSEPTTYWYMLYTVTNNSDQEVDFYPTFEIVTNTLRTVVGGDEISTSVFDAIRARHYGQYPFLIEPRKVSGRLLQGTDNAKSSVAIFRQIDIDANQFSLYVGGLSGEIQRIRNPAFDPNQELSGQNSPFFFLRKTLELRYVLPGDVRTRQDVSPTRVGRKWVMR